VCVCVRVVTKALVSLRYIATDLTRPDACDNNLILFRMNTDIITFNLRQHWVWADVSIYYCYYWVESWWEYTAVLSAANVEIHITIVLTKLLYLYCILLSEPIIFDLVFWVYCLLFPSREYLRVITIYCVSRHNTCVSHANHVYSGSIRGTTVKCLEKLWGRWNGLKSDGKFNKKLCFTIFKNTIKYLINH